MGRRSRNIEVHALPYKARVYINNQVLIPASLVRMLGISQLKYADITIRFGDKVIHLKGVRLLRTRHTDSRQFTITRNIREKYNINPGDEVEILEIRRGEPPVEEVRRARGTSLEAK